MMSPETTAVLFCVIAATMPISAVLASFIVARAIRDAAARVGREVCIGSDRLCRSVEGHGEHVLAGLDARPSPEPRSAA